MDRSLEELMSELKEDSYNSYFNYNDHRLSRINKNILELEDTSKVSDGNHSFEELYYHRMMLFAVICNSHKDKSWKSKMHSDGYELKNSFIVGIETPEGQFTYHYPIEYWKKFKVEIRGVAPEFDGHTSNDVCRLFSLL